MDKKTEEFWNIFQENINNPKYTSYTLNKGEKMFFCLRSGRDKGYLHDLNTLFFVWTHENSHVGTKDYDQHGEEFKKNFLFLLKEAVKIGIYKPVNYNTHPVPYCGDVISSTPLF